jgi:hypothetical protein
LGSASVFFPTDVCSGASYDSREREFLSLERKPCCFSPPIPSNHFLAKKKQLETFSKIGGPAGEVAHYISADNSFGVIISQSDDVTNSYRNILNYSQWVEYETHTVMHIEDAIPHLVDAFG